MDKRLEKVGIKTYLAAIADLALPRICIVCGRELMPGEKHLCLPCLADLPETHFASMSHNPMSDCLNDRIEAHRSRFGLEGGEKYSLAVALFYYRYGAGYKRITQELKYLRVGSPGTELEFAL